MNEPHEAETTGRFDASYYESVYNINGLSPLGIPWWANRFYARLAERLLRRTGGNRLLDVGCGQGFLLMHLKEHVDAWGLEVSEYAASHCARVAPRAKVVLGNIEGNLPEAIPAGSFEVVIARYVLEHLKDPGAAMVRCASLLRPGGYLLFSVPNTESPGRKLKGAEWFGFLDETHCSLLPPRQWQELVPRSGLTTERIFSDGLWDVPYLKRVPRLLQYGIFSIPTIFAVLFVSTVLPLSWGENLIAIARKPGDASSIQPTDST